MCLAPMDLRLKSGKPNILAISWKFYSHFFSHPFKDCRSPSDFCGIRVPHGKHGIFMSLFRTNSRSPAIGGQRPYPAGRQGQAGQAHLHRHDPAVDGHVDGHDHRARQDPRGARAVGAGGAHDGGGEGIVTLLEVARDAARLAQGAGAQEASAGAYRARQVEVAWRDGRLEKVAEATTRVPSWNTTSHWKLGITFQ